MANQTSKDIADLLVTAGIGTLGTNTDWGIFLNKEPKHPNNSITIYDLASEQSTYPLPLASAEIQHPRIQIRVRSIDQSDGYDKSEEIHEELSHKGNFLQGGMSYADLISKIRPYFLERDDEDRFIWVQILKAIRSTN